MTDRFYPLGKQSCDEVWKSSYEVQNEMRSFQRSAYPPGYAGHEPGARDKFGFSTPGPDAWKLSHSHLCLREDTDIAEPRRNLAVPRMTVTDERQTFHALDVPEMSRSYRSGIMSESHRSIAKTRSLPTIQKKPAPARMSEMRPAMSKMECEHFSYFVPKAQARESQERLMSRSLSKLHKVPEKKVMLPFAGEGTGFRTSCGDTNFFPPASRLHDEPTSYQSAHGSRPAFYRMSPSSMGTAEWA